MDSFCAALATTLLLLLLWTCWSFISHLLLRRTMPPGPLGSPLLGSMRRLQDVLADPSKFEQLVNRYGPVVTLWNGSVPTILVSDHQLAHEFLVSKGSIFASRPYVSSLRLLTRGFKTINSSPYGLHWRFTRRNLVTGILSPRMMSSFAGVQEQAVMELVRRLSSISGAPVTVSQEVRRTLFRILSFMCFGRQLDESQLEKLDSLMKQATTLFRPELGDVVPLLKPLNRGCRTKLDEFLQRQKEILESIVSDSEQVRPTANCYMQTLLSLQETSGIDLDFTVLVRELFIAGADTTTSCVEWTVANLINRPELQKRLLDELAEVAGRGKMVKVEHLPKLTYLNAVVKECLRKHPPVYVSAPHTPTEEVKVAGYHIPLGSTVLVHLQSLLTDEKLWRKPDEFRPERFLEKDEEGAKKDMIAFGAGRRICPGRHLGMLHVHLIVANLMQAFGWSGEDEVVDLTPQAGFTICLKNPLRAHIYPRQEFFC